MRIQLFLLLCCCVMNLFASDPEVQEIDQRIEKQTKLRVGAWCLVPWNGGYSTAEILQIEGDTTKVRVFDHSLPVSDWPVKMFHSDDLERLIHQKHESLEALVECLKQNQTLRSSEIEKALYAIDRACFAPRHPYFDTAIDIEKGMCISSPHMHVSCLELVKDQFNDATAILDVGTGTGFMAAMFAFLAPQAEVTGIEYFKELTELAKNNCQILDEEIQSRLHWVTGDGKAGHLEGAPYDVIHVGFMCKNIPQVLLDQLKPGGKMIIPVGSRVSFYDSRLCGGSLFLIEKDPDGSFHLFRVFGCSYVPALNM